MQCVECDREVNSGLLTSLGFSCNDCGDKVAAKWKEICDRELSLPLDDGPEEYDLEEFERFALRLAVHFLAAPGVKRKLKKVNPMLVSPGELSLEFKDRIINAAPDYFSTWQARGHERIFHGGTFRIIGNIPKGEAIAAAVRAGILSKQTT